MRDRDNDLPEGVINAEPAGGWSGADDGQTRESNAGAESSPDLADATAQPGEGGSVEGTDPDVIRRHDESGQD